MKLKSILALFTFFISANCKLRVVPDETYENCDESFSEGLFRSANITSMYNEFSLNDDNKVILNSNITFNIEIALQNKLFIRISGDQWYLGKWQRRFTTTMLDACQDLFNPFGVTYPYTKDLKRCPFQMGV